MANDFYRVQGDEGDEGMQSETVPNPGTEEALAQGCLCPIMDNCYGRGYFAGPPRSFIYVDNCPLHATIVDEILQRMMHKTSRKGEIKHG